MRRGLEKVIVKRQWPYSFPLQVKFALRIQLVLSHHVIMVEKQSGGDAVVAACGESLLTSAQKGVRKRRGDNARAKRGSNVF